MVAMTVLIGRAIKTVNYWKLCQHFFEVWQDLSELGNGINFKFPIFYSETKFANYVHLIYSSFREDCPDLIITFSEAVDKLKLGTSQNKSQAKDLSIQQKMFNLKFVLELSGSCDIYIWFGHTVNIIKTVNMLPHAKFDNFVEKCFEKLSKDSKGLGTNLLVKIYDADQLYQGVARFAVISHQA